MKYKATIFWKFFRAGIRVPNASVGAALDCSGLPAGITRKRDVQKV